jgi:omega-amidase
MRLALVSLDQRWMDKEANFVRCTDFVRMAAGHSCKLVVFPEMTLTGYSLELTEVAEPSHDSPTMRRFGSLACDAEMDVIFGACLVDTASARPRNTLCLARRNGEVLAIYAKIHPFSFVGEEKVMEAGNTLGIAEIGELRLGCSVCYDLRFPELFSAMAPYSNAVVNIANWPARRVAHWKFLLVSRAIENQQFVFGVNRIGTDGNGLLYEKSTLAVSPDGAVLESVWSEPEMEIYEIDLTETKSYREEFPTILDKRFGLYRELYEGI